MSFDAFSASGAAAPSAPASTPDTSSAPAAAPESSAPSSAPALSDGPSAFSSDPSAPAADPAAPAGDPPAFEPNYKFRVYDKEHEIPENFRALMTDPTNEKTVRELFEKAYGLDVAKPKHAAMVEKFNQVNTQHTQLTSQLSELRDVYNRGDFDTFFDRLKIPEEKVLQWVVNKAQYNQLPPEQRKVWEAQKAAEAKAYELEKQNTTLTQQYEAQMVQAKAQGLQVALERPDVKSFESAYDAKVGTPGSFKREIAAHGEATWNRTQGRVDLSPDQAIQEVMQKYGVFVNAPSARPAVNPAPGTAQAGRAPARPNASIPNLAGRNSSQVGKSKPKSIADLKKLALSMDR